MHGWVSNLIQLAGLLISDVIQLEKLTTLEMIGWSVWQSCQSGVEGGSLCPRASRGHRTSPEQSLNSWRALRPLCLFFFFQPFSVVWFTLVWCASSTLCVSLVMGINRLLGCFWIYLVETQYDFELPSACCLSTAGARALFAVLKAPRAARRASSGEMRRKKHSVAGFLLAWRLALLLR